MHDVLEAKKESIIKLYRLNPKTCHDESVSCLQTTLEIFDPSHPEEMNRKNVERERSNMAMELREMKENESNFSGSLMHGNLTEGAKDEETMQIQTLEGNHEDAHPIQEAQSAANVPDTTAETKPNRGSKRSLGFSELNFNVTVSNCQRSVKCIGHRHSGTYVYEYGYCFVKHSNMESSQILKWSLRVPKIADENSRNSKIGKVFLLK